MSRSLYPTTLFHFTQEMSTLISILTSQYFKVSFAREFIQGPKTRRNFGIPMVSFCDIRLTQLTQHTDSYGHYGIGLSKKWAEEKQLNPVIYMNKSSQVFDNYNAELRKINVEKERRLLDLENVKLAGSDKSIKIEQRKYDLFNMNYKKLIDPMRYMKNYQGTLHRRNGSEQTNYIFADEREWRFVPSIEESLGKPIIAGRNNIADSHGKERYNRYYDDNRLGFSFNDIMYIIVRYEKDVQSMIDFLALQYGDKNKLITRILSTELIANDM
ncbi:abortive infection system antitoxin AbiGi family protein [Pantoea dispersa]|uniref:abortive infection system antitoxin AbiGi family protein n=1 Tax=Pantoea dispersa TaxID=59814 RepID=UPI0021F7466F|nr:abortive infection system antitoxin AbiGi family protein [Pantoea dispersa]UYP74423.1 abortive infection system antitoxin AbiGi family protein [Pantoea dispersa]